MVSKWVFKMCQWAWALFYTVPVISLAWANPAAPAGKCLMIHSTCTVWKKCSASGLLWSSTSTMWTLSHCLLLFRCVPRLEHLKFCRAGRTACVRIIWDCMPLVSRDPSSVGIGPLFFLSALLTWHLLPGRCTCTRENGAAFILHGLACLTLLYYPMVSLGRYARAVSLHLHFQWYLRNRESTDQNELLPFLFFQCPFCRGYQWLAAHRTELLTGMWEYGYKDLNVELNHCSHLQFQRQWLAYDRLKCELLFIMMMMVLKNHLFKMKFAIISINYRSS